ncbi:hypothetical protein WA026_010945 [Henosepilachna vigintioctopunctata]|uniref:Protein NDNF n=1 Tax=Henosepilachna vigintioctopunctata TaxID=420089 RepID=A0AAW1V0T0_9CUCU
MLLQYLRKKYILILLHLLVLSIEGHRKSKKARDLQISPPHYDIYPSDRLPSDIQITKYILKGSEKRFSYWSTLVNGTISVSVVPCASLIQWNFSYDDDNKSGRNDMERILTNNFTTKSFPSQHGLYSLTLKVLENDTYVNIYISTEFGGPQALRSVYSENFRLFEKGRKKSASLKWSPSQVDPQSTDYCLVISTKRKFDSLCAAQASRLELPPPQNQNYLQKPNQSITKWMPLLNKSIDLADPKIACMGRKTHYSFSNLKEGQMYHYNLFALNKQSNLTYLYGSISRIFKSQTKPLSLRNGFGRANFRGLGDRAVFRYKIGRDVKDDLDLFIIPCGGPVDVKIMLKGQVVLASRRIEGFRKLTLKNPKRGMRYLIKIFTNRKEGISRRTSAVEIYVNRALSRIPIITQPKLEEYISMRECHNVTIGWILVPDSRNLNYCVEVKEGRLKDIDDYRISNQCGLANRLRKSVNFVTKHCGSISQGNGKVYTYRIRELKPGRNYIVQVTVKKPEGKASLSYDLLQVSTKKCGKQLE